MASKLFLDEMASKMGNRNKSRHKQSSNLDYLSIYTPDFESEVQHLFEQHDDALLVIQNGFSGGHGRPRDYVLIRSFIELQLLLQAFTYTPALFVLRGNPLPIRGIADDQLLQSALNTLQSPSEFLLLSLESSNYKEAMWFEGDLRWELEAIFDKFRGQSVAFGNFSRQFIVPDEGVASRQRRGPATLTEVRIGLRRISQTEISIVSDFDPQQSGQRTKFGGEPEWIQSPETLRCPACRRKMTFIAQIDSFDHDRSVYQGRSEYMFVDVGMIYVFYCFTCFRTKSVVQFY